MNRYKLVWQSYVAGIKKNNSRCNIIANINNINMLKVIGAISGTVKLSFVLFIAVVFSFVTVLPVASQTAESDAADGVIIEESKTDGATEVTDGVTQEDTKEEKKTATKKEPRIKPKKEPKAKKAKSMVPVTKILVDRRGKVITEENEREAIGKVKSIELIPSEHVEVDERTGNAHVVKTPYFTCNEGVEYAFVTRIQSQSIPNKGDTNKRSNFVWQDHLIGAFYELKSKNFYVNFLGRVSVFYPFAHTFNGMENTPKQVILYAFDMFTAPYVTFDCNYLRINLGPGLHAMYQLSDEYHLWYLGAGQQLGLEFPVARHWTILLDGLFTFDNANLGTNRYVQPFDWSYQFHASLGVRYSVRGTNKYPYAHKPHIRTAEEIEEKRVKAEEKKAAREAKKQARLAKKEAQLALKEAQQKALDEQLAQLQEQKAQIQKMLDDAMAAQQQAQEAQARAEAGTKEALDAKAAAEAAQKALEDAQAAMVAQKALEEEAAKKTKGPKRAKRSKPSVDDTEGDASKEEHLKR